MLSLSPLQNDWLMRLRSGMYAQIKGALRKVQSNEAAAKGHCCLGVACEVLAEQEIGKWIKEFPLSHKNFAPNEFELTDLELLKASYRLIAEEEETSEHLISSSGLIPLFAGSLFGLTEEDQTNLAVINDNKFPFSVIADLLESFFATGDPTEIADLAFKINSHEEMKSSTHQEPKL